MTAITFNLNPVVKLTTDQFYHLCQQNENLRLERNSTGEVIIMTPTGGGTSNRNAGLTAQLWMWNEETKRGKALDSSGGFNLPNGAIRSPDASWISREKWDALSETEKEKFLPFAPDFAIELMSPSDSLKTTQAKMKEYIENGTVLGWLINRQTRQVEIYRPGAEVEVLDNPATVSGDPLLPGFILQLEAIW